MALHIIGQGLDRMQVAELVDILRKNFLYQTPRPREGNPEHVALFMIGTDWARMLELCKEHGGWTLPEEAAKAILEQQAKAGRNDNGVDESDEPE